MSVINTMLKDLEQRGANDVAGEAILSGLSSSARSDYRDTKSTNFYLVGTLSVLVAVLVMLVFYLISPYQLVVAEQPMQQFNASASNMDLVSGTQERAVATKLDNAGTDEPPPNVQAEPEPEAAAIEARPLVEAPVVESMDRTVTTKVVQSPSHQQVTKAESTSVVAVEEEIEAEQEISKTQREPTSKENSQQAYFDAQSLYNRGKTQQSRALLRDALNYDEYNLDARKLLASIYLREERADIAVEVIEKGLLEKSDDQNLLRLYLQAQVQLGNYAEAIAIMERRLSVRTPEDVAYLAGLYQKNNDHLGAVKLYAHALQLKPTQSIWWMGQGISFEALGKREEALKSYQQSIISGQLSSQLTGYVVSRIDVIEQMQLEAAS